MLFTPVIDTSPFNEFLSYLNDETDLTSGSAFADGADDACDAYFDAMRERYDQYANRGGDWAEHAPLTQKIRGEGAPILIDQGDMRESMDRDDAMHVHEVSSDHIFEGTSDPKARFHQDGTDRMPQRQIIVPPDDATVEEMQSRAAIGLWRSVKDFNG